MSMPCSLRIDINTIMASDVGPTIKALGVDEELTMALYFMHQRVLGPVSHIYHSLSTATPVDLAMGWSDEEIQLLQDRSTIECVLSMKRQMQDAF